LPSSAWLEGDAEIAAIGRERFLLGLRPVGEHRAETAGRGEKLRRLRGDHRKIGVLGGLEVVGGHELQHLAFGDDGRGLGQDGEHLERAVFDHELEGAAEQEVADQHRGFVAPDGIGRGQAAAEIAGVDDIVMQQRRGVDEFDRRRQRHVAIAAIAAQPRRGQRQHRPEPLAAGRDDMTGELRDQRHRAVHALQDEGVHPVEIGFQEGGQAIERRRFFGVLASHTCH
jgi:hypothetical protein